MYGLTYLSCKNLKSKISRKNIGETIHNHTSIHVLQRGLLEICVNQRQVVHYPFVAPRLGNL